MTLPRKLTDKECEWVCTGLRLVIRDIEQALTNQFHNALDKRQMINMHEYNELTERIKTCENLYKGIGSCDVELQIPKGELVKQKDGTFKRQE